MTYEVALERVILKLLFSSYSTPRAHCRVDLAVYNSYELLLLYDYDTISFDDNKVT